MYLETEINYKQQHATPRLSVLHRMFKSTNRYKQLRFIINGSTTWQKGVVCFYQCFRLLKLDWHLIRSCANINSHQTVRVKSHALSFTGGEKDGGSDAVVCLVLTPC